MGFDDSTGFECRTLPGGGYAIDDAGGTVALVSPFGVVDWLRRQPGRRSERHTKLRKPTHNCYTLGLKLELPTITPLSSATSVTVAVAEDRRRAVLRLECISQDGNFRSSVEATLAATAPEGSYAWRLEYTVTCVATSPVEIPWIEFANVLPARTGECFLLAPHKKFSSVLMCDRDGTVWNFPHQHSLHYSSAGKIPALHFARGTWAGWFVDRDGCPIVEVEDCDLTPDWAICDMFYDLHCGARVEHPIKPGESVRYVARVRYLDESRGRQLLENARAIPITDDDRERHLWPRLDLGMNRFDTAVYIDRPDEASTFRPAPPVKVWDRTVGHLGRGSLRITNETASETVWTASPPAQVPSRAHLSLAAKVRTLDVTGKGMFLRVRYHTWRFEPAPPHVYIAQVLESEPINGTTGGNGWVKVIVPEIVIPEEHFDYLVNVDVVLDGRGTGWLTDLDIDVEPDDSPTTTHARRPASSNVSI